MKTIIGALLFSTPAWSVNYKTSYLAFDLPPNWECVPEGTEYVCSSGLSKGKRDAVIVFTAKERGPSDSSSAYEQHLKTPRTIPNEKGQPSQSKVIKVVRNTIGGQEWIDGLHDSSEVSNYYTRYLATVKDQLGILVTFSAHRKSYSRYSQDFDRAIRSLVVQKIPTAPLVSDTTPRGSPGMGVGSGVGIPQLPNLETTPEPVVTSDGDGDGNMSTVLGIALLFLAIVGYLVLRRKS